LAVTAVLQMLPYDDTDIYHW